MIATDKQEGGGQNKTAVTHLLTTLIQLFSLKVEGKSVVISIPKISTAFFCNPYLSTKSSETTIAAAEPSDVGQHCNFVKLAHTFGDFKIASIEYSSVNCEYLNHNTLNEPKVKDSSEKGLVIALTDYS